MNPQLRQRWHDRIARLSAKQKRVLIEQLRRAGLKAVSKSGRLVAFYQSDRDIESDELRDLCGRFLPAHMVPQRFIRQEKLALTATGKLDRQGMRARLWQEQPAQPEHDQELTTARTDVERQLAVIWCDVLGVDEISVFDNFFEVGGDSLQIIRIISRASKAGLSIAPDAIFAHPTIAELAQIADPGPEPQADTSTSFGDLPLIPIQRWFFDRIGPAPHHWNQSLRFELDSSFEVSNVRDALNRLMAHHHALRARFFKEGESWRSSIAENLAPAVYAHRVVSSSPDAQSAGMKKIADRENAAMDLAAGPLLRAIFFSIPDGRRCLVLIAHHLIVDAVSWQVLTEDLNQLLAAPQTDLRVSGTTYTAWAGQLQKLVRRDDIQASADYWLALAGHASVSLPGTGAGFDDNTEGNSRRTSATLDSDRTGLLRTELPRKLRTTVQELLLSALVRVLVSWTGRTDITLDMEGHGRESLIDKLDLSRTVGWCTSVFPVRFSAADSTTWTTPREALRRVKEQFRAVPHGGLSHGVLQYADGQAENNGATVSRRLKGAPRSQILFNYLGRESSIGHADDPLKLVDDQFGQARDPVNRRAYALELNVVIRDDQLTVNWSYCPMLHDEELISSLSREYLDKLSELVDDAADTSSAVTPSDFPMAGLDQSALDSLSSQLDELDDD